MYTLSNYLTRTTSGHFASISFDSYLATPQIQSNLGMAMMYTLATSAKEWLIGKYGKVEEEEEDEEKKEEVCGTLTMGSWHLTINAPPF